MNYYLGIKKLLLATYPWLIIRVDFWFNEATDYVTWPEKFIIIIDEMFSTPVFNSCFVTTAITIDVIYWLRKNGNDIMKAKRLRDKIVKLLDWKCKLLDWVTPLYIWNIKRTGNGRWWHDSKLSIWHHSWEFELSYYTDCELWCDVL
jgi:hypothetical protein